jgi:hypothetical protein
VTTQHGHVVGRPETHTLRARTIKRAPAATALRKVIAWYFAGVYARREGPGALPFYCDAAKVGVFAVGPSGLATGSEASLFRLFVAMSMFQAQRDVVVMRRQRALEKAAVRVLVDGGYLARAIASHRCSALLTFDGFSRGCDVGKRGDVVDCGRHAGLKCHVKDATGAFNRMGDMGKLPTSALLLFQRDGGIHGVLDDVRRKVEDPAARAAALVERLGKVHRVGRKLATMFVSALSTPALAPGLTPWFPEIDGNELVVVDTNVARAVDVLRPVGASRTYDARERWIREQAGQVDLRAFHPEAPTYSPRLVQQALYAFCSSSNRSAAGDECAERTAPCPTCSSSVCPFRGQDRARRSASGRAPRASGADRPIYRRRPRSKSQKRRHEDKGSAYRVPVVKERE